MTSFSVVTPVFNGMPLLRGCVGSVRCQVGQADGSLAVEHLIQDGGSSDGTPEFALSLMQDSWKKPNYRIQVESGPDRGMYDAINKGWAHADGDWLSWLNADEQYLPGTLERVASTANRHPEADVFFGDVIVVDGCGNAVAARREIPVNQRHLCNGFLYSASATLFFRRRLLEEKLLIFDTAFRLAGDFDLMLKLLCAGKIVRHIPAYLSLFTNDGNNLSTRRANDMRAETQTIRARYGGHNHPVIRRLFLVDRWIRRLLAGCYRFDTLSYGYAVDEKPAYVLKTARAVGFRFKI